MDFHNEARQSKIGRILLAATHSGQQTFHSIEGRGIRANVEHLYDCKGKGFPERRSRAVATFCEVRTSNKRLKAGGFERETCFAKCRTTAVSGLQGTVHQHWGFQTAGVGSGTVAYFKSGRRPAG